MYVCVLGVLGRWNMEGVMLENNLEQWVTAEEADDIKDHYFKFGYKVM